MFKVLRIFYGYLLEKKALAFVFFLLAFISPLIDSILPYFYKLFVDAITKSEFDILWKLLILYVGFYFLSQIIEAVTRLVADMLSFDAGIKARRDVFKKIHQLDFAYHTNKSSGSLISVIKRGDGAFWDINESIHFRIIPVTVSFIVMMFVFVNLSSAISIFAFISFIASLFVMRSFIKLNMKTRDRWNKEEDTISAMIVDNMVNFETVKLFAKEDWEEKRLKDRFVFWKKALWDFGLSFRYLDISMALVVVLGMFSMLVASLNAVSSGRLTIGDFVLVVGFTSAFYPKLFQLVWGFRQITKNYSDIKKYFGILDVEIKVKDPVKPKKVGSIMGEIEYKNVSFTYEKKTADALKDINLLIRPGQSVAFVGRSGAGKTTMIKLLMRFFDVDRGSISIDGVNIKNITKNRLRLYMGVVPQEPVLFNNTIAYNISYGKPGSKMNEIVAASKLANIHKFILTLPKGYQTQVGERGIKLSGGQKQRVAIARMILSDPDIVIFDEATSQLDSESERLIQDAFWKAVHNKTTLIVAHRLSTVMRADKIVVMENGKIIELGSHQNLIRKKGGLYKHFWDMQTLD